MLQALKNYYHLVQAVSASLQYGKPAAGLTIIGVTGTDGKTTTASLLYHMLKETGHKTALISTVGAYIGDKEYDTGFHVSTPHSSHLQSYIAKAKKAGVTHLVLEVTSHALDQYRVFTIPFKVGVLTNVSREHLDYHKTMENYMTAKAKLLLSSEIAVINKDDKSYEFMKQKLKGKQVVTYGLKTADVTPENHPFPTISLSEFNISNTLAALAVCDSLGVDQKAAVTALTTFTLPIGRVETVYNQDFRVIIDFAHTPNALENILKDIRKEKKGGRLIHVFGSAGQRDKGKRPLMGKASSEYADMSIITSEDPRNESQESITEDITSGMKDGKSEVWVIADRQQAITTAISMAQKHDIVLITGKGHERSMNTGNGEEPWSEHTAVEKALKERKDLH